MPLYFAYGSNLKRSRVEARVGRKLGPAVHALLRDYRLAFNKRAAGDGSGRANAIPSPGTDIRGVLYQLTATEFAALDDHEGVGGGHYRRVVVEVEGDDGARVQAETYLAGAAHVDDSLSPAADYLALVVEGAREHLMPAVYIAEIEAIGRGAPSATLPVASAGQNPRQAESDLGTDMTKNDRAREALAALSRDVLATATEELGLAVADKRKAEAHVDAIVAAGRVEAALAALKRADLKTMCGALGLDDSGKEKEPIVARLLECFQAGQASGFVLESSAAPAKGTKAAKAPKEKSEALPLGDVTADYRHDEAKRKNNPPAGLVEFDKPPARKKKDYAYDPHLDPQLQWAGKAEHTSFEVDTVSLHIHERVSTQAILRAVRRDEAEPQMNLFARPELPAAKEVDFYAHDVGWSNRLILGDSLIVMNSLLERENMTGQVQCCFVDPPYGVKFNSNFQPSISRRNVTDGEDESLTSEPEQIQAFRDTWELGVHSYLGYLRDRLKLAHALLADTGSLFLQISDENVHHAREVADEIFGRTNFVLTIIFKKKGSTTQTDPVNDFILWYAKSKPSLKTRPIYERRSAPEDDPKFNTLLSPSGEMKRIAKLSSEEVEQHLRQGWEHARVNYPLVSQDVSDRSVDFVWNGKAYSCGKNAHWRYDPRVDMHRLARVGRIFDGGGKSLGGVMKWSDWPYVTANNIWNDLHGEQDPIYVVQTNRKAISRCLLMTTDPGDLVFDPTCGSGSTAFVAEQLGRRWMSCDTSRVALSLARQRLLTARFPYYVLRTGRVRDGFAYKTAPHVTIGSIAKNVKLDACATRAEMDAAIAREAEQETLYDQPEEQKSKVRVTGPFTVEAIPLASMEDASRDVDGPISKSAAVPGHFSDETSQFLTMMMDLLRQTGVNFPGNKKLRLPSLRSVKGDYEWFHAEGNSDAEGDPRRFAVSFGPRHGPVTTTQVMQAIKEARGYDVVLFTGFACDPEARKMIDQGMHGTELHFANAAPDILVGDLLKKKRTDQLFAVFGAPDVKVHTENGGSLVSVELVGVDLYDPNTGETRSAKGTEAAALFVDHDYDGKTFCISQALFPGGNNPWEKLQKALKGQIDEEKFAALQTTRSLPFKPGNKVAVKVIDDRGNEVIKLVDARKALTVFSAGRKAEGGRSASATEPMPRPQPDERCAAATATGRCTRQRDIGSTFCAEHNTVRAKR